MPEDACEKCIKETMADTGMDREQAKKACESGGQCKKPEPKDAMAPRSQVME